MNKRKYIESVLKEIAIRLLKPEEYTAAVMLHKSKGVQHIDKKGLIWQYHNSNLPFDGCIVGAFHNETLVATQAFIPLIGVHKGNEIVTLKSEYTLVDQEYRGMKLFEKMYDVGTDWAEQKGVACIWGFTNAVKPFTRVGFMIGKPIYTETVVCKPIDFIRKRKIAEKCLSLPMPAPKSISLPKEEFGLKKDSEYLKYRYEENPFREIVWFDAINSVLYTRSTQRPEVVFVSELSDISLLQASFKLFVKKFRGQFVVLQRVTSKPGFKALGVFPNLVKTTESNVQVVFRWLGGAGGDSIPEFTSEEGYSEGVS